MKMDASVEGLMFLSGTTDELRSWRVLGLLPCCSGCSDAPDDAHESLELVGAVAHGRAWAGSRDAQRLSRYLAAHTSRLERLD